MIRLFNSLAFVVPVLSIAVAGCGSGDKAAPAEAHSEAGHDEHSHAAAGPHGGDLIGLGDEEYHAELVHDEAAGTVTLYVLDSAAKASVPIEATEVTINLTHEGQGEQLKLVASTDQGDPTGKSSRFVLSDTKLAEHLHHEDAKPQLVITIDGKQFRGTVEHHHDEHGESDSQ